MHQSIRKAFKPTQRGPMVCCGFFGILRHKSSQNQQHLVYVDASSSNNNQQPCGKPPFLVNSERRHQKFMGPAEDPAWNCHVLKPAGTYKGEILS